MNRRKTHVNILPWPEKARFRCTICCRRAKYESTLQINLFLYSVFTSCYLSELTANINFIKYVINCFS